MISLSVGSDTLDLSGLVTSLRHSDGWSFGTTDPLVGKPRKQGTGKDSPTAQVSLRLHAEFPNAAGVLEQLRTWADANEVVTMQRNADGVVVGTYLIDGLQERPVWAMPSGEIVSDLVDFSLVDPGDTEGTQTPEGVEGGSDAASDVPPAAEDRSEAPDDVPPREIARR